MKRRFLAMVILAVLAAGCGPKVIDGTGIKDSETNRAIYEVIETYRTALESRDVDAIAALLSTEYFENASTTATSEDDYGIEALREKVLPLLDDHVKAVQFRIRLTRIEVIGARAMADYEYWLKFLYAEGGREGWHVTNEFNRLEFVREGEAWKIAAGL